MQIPTTIGFIMRSPPISYVSNIYYLPFNVVVWLCSISMVILCTAVIAFTLKFHMKYDSTRTENITTSDFILFAIALTCQMGSTMLTNLLSARISIVSITDNESIKISVIHEI